MLRILGKIRKKLLHERKVARYLLYALGEILLVVLGILIALQIDNWNQSKVDVETQRKYLTNILSDLEEQLTYIEMQQTYEKRFMEAAIPEITYFNAHLNFRVDSTFFDNISALDARKTFITTDPSFTDLISSGNIKLIKNEIIKKKILAYYQDLKLSEKIIQNNNIFIVDQHFGNVVKDIGYYFFDAANLYLKDVDQLNPEVYKAATQLNHFNPYLASTSLKMLQDPEKQLQLMNSLNQRANVAIAHYQRAIILEEKTKDLITEIKQELSD
jgi:hypothetical protein